MIWSQCLWKLLEGRAKPLGGSKVAGKKGKPLVGRGALIGRGAPGRKGKPLVGKGAQGRKGGPR